MVGGQSLSIYLQFEELSHEFLIAVVFFQSILFHKITFRITATRIKFNIKSNSIQLYLRGMKRLDSRRMI